MRQLNMSVIIRSLIGSSLAQVVSVAVAQVGSRFPPPHVRGEFVDNLVRNELQDFQRVADAMKMKWRPTILAHHTRMTMVQTLWCNVAPRQMQLAETQLHRNGFIPNPSMHHRPP